ncbi:structural protein [Xenorhabdus sp. SF857]|uniref:structural protein n=1 Tax=Xenorhabdus bakwenae TaxID=3026967 RepID=UPI002557D94C|nr:structural protein [Xenorhabdus sp. SF857]WFQ80042.1 structural protein [Xenorhabdus sp. SF857]
MSKGIRNDNPGNIRHGDSWQGLRKTQTDKAFCQFIAPEWGIRAMLKILRNYERKYGLNTIRQIITRWAPPSENDTESYIAYVCKSVGIASSAVIDVDSEVTMIKLVRAMIQMENGQQPYPVETFRKAFELL